MTLHELNALYYIELEIKAYRDKIAELRELAESITPNYSGMPSGGSQNRSKVESAAVSIVAYMEMLDKAVQEKVETSQRIHEYILAVPDAQTRQIMFLRFVQCKSWGEIARRIGGNNTASAVRMRAIRYIDGGKKKCD